MRTPDERLASFCKAGGFDGVVIRRRANIAWATGGADVHCDLSTSLGVATLVWTPREKHLFTDNIEAPRLAEEEPLKEWRMHEARWWEDDPALSNLLARGTFASDFPSDPLAELRASLTPAEIDHARTLGEDTAEVVCKLLRVDVKPGMTEWHLAGAVSGWLRDRGIIAHVVLVAADERIGKFRHPVPTRKAIGHMAMVAVCAQRHGLIVSVTRLVHFGPLSDDLKRRHAAVCAVDRALHKATRPGTRWCDALNAGIKEYEARGFGEEWTRHHQGGPMGYECRDFKATPTETRIVAENQLVGWNPSITGTKSEDTILSTGEIITPSPLQWPMLDGRPDILVR